MNKIFTTSKIISPKNANFLTIPSDSGCQGQNLSTDLQSPEFQNYDVCGLPQDYKVSLKNGRKGSFGLQNSFKFIGKKEKKLSIDNHDVLYLDTRKIISNNNFENLINPRLSLIDSEDLDMTQVNEDEVVPRKNKNVFTAAQSYIFQQNQSNKQFTSADKNKQKQINITKNNEIIQQIFIKKQNKELRETVNQYLQRIRNLKQENQSHEKQIETLLTFNEKLMVIIETELNNKCQNIQYIDNIKQEYQMAKNILEGTKYSENIQEQYKDEDEQRDIQVGPLLGYNRQQVFSYQASNSDYQKQYSQYTANEKLREVLAVITAYKRQYGNTMKEYDKVKNKIKRDHEKDGKRMNKIIKENKHYYGDKIEKLEKLKDKIEEEGAQRKMEKIIDSGRLSESTRLRLIGMLGSSA